MKPPAPSGLKTLASPSFTSNQSLPNASITFGLWVTTRVLVPGAGGVAASLRSAALVVQVPLPGLVAGLLDVERVGVSLVAMGRAVAHDDHVASAAQGLGELRAGQGLCVRRGRE